MKAELAKSEVDKEDGEAKGDADDGAKVGTEKTDGIAEEGTDAPAKREREPDGDHESEDELDDTPPMYRQARGLFLKPEVRMRILFCSNATEIAAWLEVLRSSSVPTFRAVACFHDVDRFGDEQVEPASEYKLKWTDPDEPGLIKFLVEEKG